MEKKYYHGKNREQAIRHAREYREKNLPKIAEYEKTPNRRDMHERYDINHIEERRARDRQHYQDLKRIVFEHYGKKCQWPDGCDVSDPDMLQIDHVDGHGGKERRRGIICRTLYAFLIKNDFPKGYRLLCANHNWKHRANMKMIGGSEPQRWNGEPRIA